MRKQGVLAVAAIVAGLMSVANNRCVFVQSAFADEKDGGFLGIYLEDEQTATKGAYVEDVAEASPADKAGIRKGDLVVALNGERTPNSHALIERLMRTGGGEAITLRLSRDEWEREVKVTLGKREGGKKAPTTEPSPAAGERGFLGCFFKANPEGPGALIDRIVDGSPAAKAALKKGDVVTGINGQPVTDYTALQEILRGSKPGQKVQLRVSREGWDREVSVELGRRPAESAPAPTPAPEAKPTPAPKATPAPAPAAKKPAFLGVALVDNDGKGPLKIDDVQDNSPAAKAGVKQGETLVAMGDKKVNTIKDFEDVMKKHFAGDVLVLHLERDGGWAREVRVTLGQRPE